MAAMQSGGWDTLYNLLLFVLWFALWSAVGQTRAFNPYLSPVLRAAFSALDVVKPMFLRLPRRWIALILWIVLLLGRGLLVPRHGEWILLLGVERQADPSALLSSVPFSLISFGVFLFRLWTIATLFLWSRDAAGDDFAAGALCGLGHPFTALRPALRLPALLLLGSALVLAMDGVGYPVYGRTLPAVAVATGLSWGDGAPALTAARVVLVVLAGVLQVLPTLASLMILLLIGLLVSTLTGAGGLMFFCRNAVDFLLGPLRRLPLRLGVIDFTPLLFLLGAYLLQRHLMPLLQAGCDALVP